MTHRILVFESDTAFAQTLRNGFEGRDVNLEVVSEGAEGLERAAAEPPALILLSIELPSMNGFLVCKKIKKNGALKNIPLIILSSDANAAEIFEQHKKLRTRAEDYVRKPVAFDALLSVVRAFLPVGDKAKPAAATPSASNIDDEIDAFAEDAFDSLLMDDDVEEDHTAVVPLGDLEQELAGESVPPPPPVASAPPPPPAQAAPPSVPPPASIPPDSLPPAPPSVAPAPASVAPASPISSAPQALMDDSAMIAAQARIAELEAALGVANEQSSTNEMRATASEGKVGKLEREVAELKTKGSSGSGISSREFLDLREQLNTKDKEILDLRDKVSARDKELVELRDRNIAVERQNADIEDRALAAERKSADFEETVASLTQDKEVSTKRFEDTKARLERAEEKARGLEEKARGLEEEVESAKATASAQVAAAKHDATEQIEAAKAAAAQAEEEAVSKVASARAESAAAVEKAVADASAEKNAVLEAKAAEQAAALEALASEKSAEHALALETLSAGHAAALEALAAEKTAEAAAALEARVAELEAEKANALAEAENNHSRELAVLGRKLADTESRVEEASTKLAETEQAKSAADEELLLKGAEIENFGEKVGQLEGDLATLRAQKADLDERLSKAMSKISADDMLLERARKAMAIGLGLLEDQKKNSVDAAAE